MTKGINKRYSEFFFVSRSATSEVGKKIPVLDPDHMEQFLETMVYDPKADDDTKLLAGLLFSGGMRVSEALNLKKSDFSLDRGSYMATLGVLKKRKLEITREAIIHPRLIELLQKKLSSKRYNEFIFKSRAERGRPPVFLTRQNALYKMKKLLGEGMTNHGLRHSNVAMLMHKGYTDVQIAKILEMSIGNVANYAHVNSSSIMRKIYSDSYNSD